MDYRQRKKFAKSEIFSNNNIKFKKDYLKYKNKIEETIPKRNFQAILERH